MINYTNINISRPVFTFIVYIHIVYCMSIILPGAAVGVARGWFEFVADSVRARSRLHPGPGPNVRMVVSSYSAW